jgi:hypothetical protein
MMSFTSYGLPLAGFAEANAGPATMDPKATKILGELQKKADAPR